MASPPPHRKLLQQDTNSSAPITVTVQTCLYYCNTEKNETTGYCPRPCLAICPSTCLYSIATLIPPSNSPSQPNTPHKNLSPLLISMLLVLASSFLLLSIYFLFLRLYPRSRTQTQTRPSLRGGGGGDDPVDEEQGRTVVFNPVWCIPTVGLTPAAISSIKACKYARGHVDGGDCAVCLAEFEEGDELRILPKCSHAFHLPCVDTWLRSHTNCPLCRAPVINNPPDDRDPTAEDPAPGGPGGGGATEDRAPRERMIARSASVDCTVNGDGKNEGETINSGNNLLGCSCSQRWGESERGEVNLVSRSMSCSGKMFLSRYVDSNNGRLESREERPSSDGSSPNS